MGDVRVNLEGSGGIRLIAAGKNQRLAVAVQRQGPIAGTDAFPAVFIGKNCGIFQKIPGGKGDGQRLQPVIFGSLPATMNPRMRHLNMDLDAAGAQTTPQNWNSMICIPQLFCPRVSG